MLQFHEHLLINHIAYNVFEIKDRIGFLCMHSKNVLKIK